MHRVLIIEDDDDIAGLVSLHLGDAGFEATRAAEGTQGFEEARSGVFDLIVLDLMLPGMDGLDVCRRLRLDHVDTPILMLTARSEELDRVLGLELGADDYLTKPFSVRELVARVKAMFRRIDRMAPADPPADVETLLRHRGLYVDVEKRKVTLEGRTVELTPKEFDLLALFARHPGRCFTRQQLLDRVWGYQYSGYEHTVNSHISRLRAKIEHDPSEPAYIQTVWGYGYKLAE